MKTRISNFFLAPSSPANLAVLRVGVALVLLLQALYIAPDFFKFYGTGAILQSQISAHFASLIPSATELAVLLARWNLLPVSTSLTAMAVVYVIALLGLLSGFAPRRFAFVAWLLHMIFARTHSTAYGADTYAHFSLFYLVVFPSQFTSTKSSEATLGLRVLQLHMCFSYISSGIEKSTGPQWWNGEVIWRALQLPVYSQGDFSWVTQIPWILPILSVGTLLIEIGYPVWMFWSRTRTFGLIAIVALHAGIGLFLGLKIFALIMMVINLALFTRIPEAFVLALESFNERVLSVFSKTKKELKNENLVYGS